MHLTVCPSTRATLTQRRCRFLESLLYSHARARWENMVFLKLDRSNILMLTIYRG